MSNRAAFTITTIVLALEIAMTWHSYEAGAATWRILVLSIALGVCLGLWILFAVTSAIDK